MARVHVSLGSNVNREANLSFALELLQRSFGELAVSPVYESDAVGFEGEPFFNLVVVFDTDCGVDELVAAFHELEADCGRTRGDTGLGPRALDVDLLTYGDWSGRTGGVDLPRDDVTRYAFVLRPLAEIAPRDTHPVLGVSYAQLWREHPDNGLARMRRVELGS